VRDTTLGRVSQETGHVFLDEMEISEAEFKAPRKSISLRAEPAGMPPRRANS